MRQAVSDASDFHWMAGDSLIIAHFPSVFTFWFFFIFGHTNKFAFRIRSSQNLGPLGQFLHSIGLALVSRGAENEPISPISRGATWPT